MSVERTPQGAFGATLQISAEVLLQQPEEAFLLVLDYHLKTLRAQFIEARKKALPAPVQAAPPPAKQGDLADVFKEYERREQERARKQKELQPIGPYESPYRELPETEYEKWISKFNPAQRITYVTTSPTFPASPTPQAVSSDR